MKTIWGLFRYLNQQNSSNELICFWVEFPQLEHLIEVIGTWEMTRDEMNTLLNDHAVSNYTNDSYSLEEIKEGVVI